MGDKTVLSVTMYHLIGFVLFLVILGILNIVNSESFIKTQAVEFFNHNLWIVIIFMFSFYLGELFYIFEFPYNLASPLFNASGGVFLAKLIFQIFYLVGNLTGNDSFLSLKSIEPVAFFLVCLGVLVFSYTRIFLDRYHEMHE